MTGERGPRGDHGQTGATGPVGPRGKISALLAYGIALAAVVLAVLSYIQVERINGLQDDICAGQNEVRGLIRSNIETEIHNLDHTDRSLFPSISREQFDVLLEQRRQQLERQVSEATPIGCTK